MRQNPFTLLRLGCYLFVFTVFLFPSLLSAKQLSLLLPNMAFEIGGTGGMLKSFDPSTESADTSITWSNNNQTLGYSGNVFLVANVHAKMAIRAGIEVLVPQTLNDIQGADSGGTVLVYGKSTTYSAIPTVAWDMFYVTMPKFRAFIGGELGYAIFRSKEEWTYSDAQVAAGYSNYTANIKGNTVSIYPYTGLEVAFVDRYSIVLKVGYRILRYKTLKASSAYTNSQDIGVASGATVLDGGGTGKVYDFSGLSVGMGFRLYF